MGHRESLDTSMSDVFSAYYKILTLLKKISSCRKHVGRGGGDSRDGQRPQLVPDGGEGEPTEKESGENGVGHPAPQNPGRWRRRQQGYRPGDRRKFKGDRGLRLIDHSNRSI